MKKFLSLLLALTMVVGMLTAFTVSAAVNTTTFYNAATNEAITSLDGVESVFATTTFTGRYEDNASVIASHYNAEGKLEKVEFITPVQATIGASVTYTTPVISVTDTDILKIFAWTGMETIKPLLKFPGVISRSEDIPLPTATVTELDVSTITTVPLTFAMNFKADPATEAQLLAYSNWYADFELKVNKDVTFNLDGTKDGYLAGQYDGWSPAWVTVPKKDITLTADTPLKIMATGAEAYGEPGLKYTYGEVYDRVKDFDCGVFFTDAFLAANPDLEVTLELRMYNPLDESESYVIGETYTFGKAIDVELPTATVTELDVSTLPVELDFALNFKADDITDAQAAKYANWYADYVLTVNKEVTFNANGGADGYLSGQYDAWSSSWVSVPFEDATLEADTPIRVMETAAALMGQSGLKLTCYDIFTEVKDFDCGIFFTEEFKQANPDLEVTLELRIYNPEDESESYVIGETYTYRPVSLPTATVTELDVSTLPVELDFALNFKADDITDAQAAVYANWYADYVLTVNKEVTFNANGTADGYLSGQYDAWSSSWVSVPFEDATLEANTPIRVMETAAALMGQSGLKLTCYDIFTEVKDFDCGIFFTDEFKAANPDLEVTLELKIYNPENEEESYTIGRTYTYKPSDLPTATVTELDVTTLPVELDFALNFKVDEITEAQAAKYANWYADYVLTVNKEVTFNANGTADGYLSGQYDAWSSSWVSVPFEDATLEADTPIRVMETAAALMGQSGLKLTCYDIFTEVKDFDCGIFFTEAFKQENPDLEVTLELRIYNPEDESESYVIGRTYTYRPGNLPTATVTELDVTTLPVDLDFALNFKADTPTAEQIEEYGNWYADFVLVTNKEITLNANGGADGFLSGQYDAWSENWVSVPFEDATLPANEPVKIMETAAELMGQSGLKLTCYDVYSEVKDFDCGVSLTDEFLAANKDLEIILELRIYNPDDETEFYTIGRSYAYRPGNLPTATVTELDVTTLPVDLDFALNFKADTPTAEQIEKYGNWYADYVLTVNKEVTINADGTADGYLSGQYDAWSENWVSVPFEDATLEADTPIRVMETAAELMGQSGLKLTCYDIYTEVKDFDCGIYFTDAFKQANPDLEVTLELRIYNPEDETEFYTIGRTYVYHPDVNVTTEATVLTSANVTAEVPAGVVMEEGTTALALSTSVLEDSKSGVEAGEHESLSAMDVHVEGVSDYNTTPIIVTVNEAIEPGYNKGNLSLYHVEDGETVKMEEVATKEDLVAHNQFTYDPADGTLAVALATFSEITVVAETEQGWEGNIATGFSGGTGTESDPYIIANADQMAYLSAVVGGMEGRTQDSFDGKYFKLISDINFADGEEANDPNKIFYPVGYYNSEYTYERTNTAITSGMKPFMGTFDGNGHTIKNIYQNTWEMKGDHEWYTPEEQYYRDGMGIFGKVYGATIKNLTVDNFKSDGEITTTGVIATYAESWEGRSAIFENIAITNCNPRVYNIGNGGIVGSGGWYSREKTDIENTPIIFRNITVDNTNKISALWGSYDVACAGIMGRYYPDSKCGVSFENCHVAAQLDVFNDVCGNYQYYWYRYAGMMIGTVQANTTDENGYTVPDMTGITAKNCTVHFGDWNNYYYCEMVVNSIASYTHDHQFSRLDEVDSVDVANMTVTVDGVTTAIPTTGRKNYVVVNGTHATENATCYHFVDGAVWNHEDAGYEESIDENGDGKPDLKEDKQHIYLPFNQLFQGSGWGVKNVPIYNDGKTYFEGITILDRVEANSVEKFKSIAKETYITGTTVTIGDLFEAAAQDEVEIVGANVQVMVSPTDETSTVTATYEANATDWTQGTLAFEGLGAATITITDYYFCTPTTITVTVVDLQPVEKFDLVFPNTESYLYRVGNKNTVAFSSLFKAKADAEIGTVAVTVEAVDGSAAGGSYDASTQNITFTGTGVVKVTVTDNDYCIPTELYLEVVDATNAIGATHATSGNIVLLNNCGVSTLNVSGDYTFYGNGFTMTYSGDGRYLKNGLKQGVVTVSENGTLDNVRIVAPIYPNAYLYYSSASIGQAVTSGPSETDTSDTTKIRYYYQLSAVAASGNATISNCYIYGGRNNIFVNTGDVTVKDTVLENGVVANMQIQSNSSHTVTLDNLTTIQYQTNSTVVDTTKVMMGAGIIVGPETNDNPAIVLNGELKQYNWVTADDKNAVSDEAAQKIIDAAVRAEDFNHTVNGKTASNLTLIYMNTYDAPITNNTGLPYDFGTVSISGVSGNAYSLKNATADQIYSDYQNADKSTENSWYEPQFNFTDDLGGQKVPDEGGDEFCYVESKLNKVVNVMFPSGDTKEFDLSTMVNITKYTGQDLGMGITCHDENGNAVAVTNGKVSLSNAGNYTVTYTVTDTVFYDKDGVTVSDTKEYSWNVTITVSLKDNSIPDAYFDYDTSKQVMGYAKKSIFAGGQTQYLPFLAGLKIYDYNGQDAYLRFDGDNDFNKIASATITGYTSANHVLIEVKLIDGGVINVDTTARAVSGGSTYTGTLNTSGNTLYYVNGGTTSATTTTWVISNYTFIGNNGVEIKSGAVTFANCENGSVPTGTFGTTIKATVIFDANEGTCTQTTAYATSVSTSVTLPTPKRGSYMFTGWYTAANGGTRVGGAGDSYTPSADITLYAQWGKPSTVLYDANGGSCDRTSDNYTGTALTLPTPTRDGYWFTGWYDAAEGGNKIGAAGASYQATGDITLYAQWSPVYTVTYNANGGSVTPASASYQGTTLTLPTPTRDGYAFNGWYTAASGGTKIGIGGNTYTPTANITLYAQWKDPVVVTYDATTNGGSCGTTSQTYLGTALTLPTPNDRTGYTFDGWYTAASGGTKIESPYTPTANITLYAQWTHISYTITISKQNNATVTVDKTTAYYNETVSVTVSFSQNNNKTLTVKDASNNTILSQSAAGTYTFTMPASNVTIEASSSGTCFTPDTLITLADGGQKRVDELTYADQLLVWDFVSGEYTARPAVIIDNHGYDNYLVTTVYFDNGSKVNTIGGHAFYDVDAKRFVMLSDTNVADYIGHTFVVYTENGNETAKLVDYNIEEQYTESWSVLTAEHHNCIVEGMLALTPGQVEGSENYLMPFAVGEDMKYDEAAMQADIETYGLYTYEDFEDYVTYEQFMGLNLPIFKVSVGKGFITFDEIIFLLELHMN